jgi:hypothetical protein
MNLCDKCCTRFDACSDCHAAELAAKDKYIEVQDVIISGQRKEIARLRAALQEIAGFDCACFEDDSCAACLTTLALEAE